MRRRKFVGTIPWSSIAWNGIAVSQWFNKPTCAQEPSNFDDVQVGEDIFGYIDRKSGKFDRELYLRILGNADDFKEGDEIVGVAAPNETSCTASRTLLANTRLADIDANPPLIDDLYALIRSTTSTVRADLTIGKLKASLIRCSVT